MTRPTAATTPCARGTSVRRRGILPDQRRDYVNPHEPEIQPGDRDGACPVVARPGRVLDQAAAAGGDAAAAGATAGLNDAADPFLFEQYARRRATYPERLTSKTGRLPAALAGLAYSLEVCSFRVHLAEPSRLRHLRALSLWTPP
jgi:hypothetical protein